MLADFLITFIEIGEELDYSVSFLDYVAVRVVYCSISLFLITSFLGGELGRVLNDGVFLRVRDFSLRDLDVVDLLYRLLGDFEDVSNFGMERCKGYYGDI